LEHRQQEPEERRLEEQERKQDQQTGTDQAKRCKQRHNQEVKTVERDNHRMKEQA
jgi:hypothetical protein